MIKRFVNRAYSQQQKIIKVELQQIPLIIFTK